MRDVLAIDLGATNLRIALVSDDGEISEKEKTKTPRANSADEFIEKIAVILKRYIKKHKIPDNTPIGMSVAGPVMDKAKKLVFLTDILREFVPFIELERSLGKEMLIVNDAAAAVLAERKFGVGGDDIVYITFSSGIGGGVIKDGEVLPDSETEIGHFEIKSNYEMQCNCDGLNHWEAYTSGKNMADFFKVWGVDMGVTNSGRYNSIFKIYREYEKGDKFAKDFMEEIHKVNSKGIKLVEKKYQPMKIVIGGGVAFNNQEIFWDGFKKYLNKDIYEKISVTKLGDEISLLGVAVYVGSLK